MDGLNPNFNFFFRLNDPADIRDWARMFEQLYAFSDNALGITNVGHDAEGANNSAPEAHQLFSAICNCLYESTEGHFRELATKIREASPKFPDLSGRTLDDFLRVYRALNQFLGSHTV